MTDEKTVQALADHLSARARMTALSHWPEPNGAGCECGFCAWSTEHVTLMVDREVYEPAVKQLVRDRDALAAEVERLTRERDEARAAVARVEALTRSRSGNEYEHDHGIGDGHDECPACWAEDIRAALDTEGSR